MDIDWTTLMVIGVLLYLFNIILANPKKQKK